MVTLKLDPSNATLSKVLRALKLRPDEVDQNFGVVNLSDEPSLYAILVDEKVAARIEGVEGVQGTFSNPRIEPFGPPRSK